MNNEQRKLFAQGDRLIREALKTREDVAEQLEVGALLSLRDVRARTGYTVRYLRKLCRERRIAHHRLLGRFYLTPEDVAALLSRVNARIPA